MDSKDDTLRIVDYKTGGAPKTPENIAQLFTPAEGRPNYIFQTFLYAAILCRKQAKKVAPALLYIHRAAQDTYSPVIEMGAARQPKQPVNKKKYSACIRHSIRQNRHGSVNTVTSGVCAGDKGRQSSEKL